MPKLVFPDFAKDRGAWFWARPMNLLASRRKFMRQDQSLPLRRPTVHGTWKKHLRPNGAPGHGHGLMLALP